MVILVEELVSGQISGKGGGENVLYLSAKRLY